MNTFIGTTIQKSDLTKWILEKFKKYKVTDIRYFGSRIHGLTKPTEKSDIDVYILFDKKNPGRGPLFSELYKHEGKNYVIEFHAFMDFHDDYVPSYLLQIDAKNELKV
jgi:predicted nucleotidyltransferase